MDGKTAFPSKVFYFYKISINPKITSKKMGVAKATPIIVRKQVIRDQPNPNRKEWRSFQSLEGNGCLQVDPVGINIANVIVYPVLDSKPGITSENTDIFV